MSTKDKPRPPLAPIVAAALLCGVFTAGCDVSHAALAATFGGLTVINLALPALVLCCTRAIDRVLVIAVSIIAIMAVWLRLDISWAQWWACATVLTAYAAAIAGAALLLNRIGVPAVVSAAIVVIVALAWLSWPIWLSPWIAGHAGAVNWLVFAHPLLTINGVLIDQGIWTERPMMYGWTALNQDVPYSMPSNIFWCVALHLGIALAAIISIRTARKLIG